MREPKRGPAAWARNYAAFALVCAATTLDAWAEHLVRHADRLTAWSVVIDHLDHATRYSQARDLIDAADRTPAGAVA